MKANETKLQMIIEGAKQFVVPLFQRPYSWEQKHWDVLWDDLLDLCEEDQPRNHFMGSIVTMPAISVPEGVTKYVLIDGQQRLTTILLILALIRNNAKNLPGTLAKEPRRNKMSKLQLFLFHESGIRSVCRMPLKSKGFDASSRHCSLSWTSACAVNGRQRKRTRLVGVALVV